LIERLRRRGARSGRDHLAAGESGQALLELALITPILILLVMAIFQFAYVFESQSGLTNAVREAARRAAANSQAAPAWTSSGGDLGGFVIEQLCGNVGGTCDGGLLEENVPAFAPARLIGDPVVTFCSYPAGGDTQYQVQVFVQYRHPLFFGPMAFATDALDGSRDGDWTLAATGQMRLENVDPDTATDPGATC
jgi:hypothetical protein